MHVENEVVHSDDANDSSVLPEGGSLHTKPASRDIIKCQTCVMLVPTSNISSVIYIYRDPNACEWNMHKQRFVIIRGSTQGTRKREQVSVVVFV